MRKSLMIIALFFLTVLVFSQSSLAADDFKVNLVSELSAATPANHIAEVSLQQLAARDKRGRIISGVTIVATGGGLAALGVLVNEEGATEALMIGGGVVAASGVLVLLFKSESEREYGRVLRLDEAEREVAAEESLAFMAGKARRARIINGVIDGAIAVTYLISYVGQPHDAVETDPYDYDLYSAILFAGTAAYQFLVPSHVENVYNGVVKAKAKANVGLKFGEVNGLVVSLDF